MASPIERHITAYLVQSMITTYCLPERMPYDLHFKDEGKAVDKIGKFIIRSIDKYGIVMVKDRLNDLGYDATVKDLGDFYRWWRQNIMGFDTVCGRKIETIDDLESTINY